MLKIIPLGGLGEIGLNMMVFEDAETAFIVDAGLMFPEDYMLGVDFVIPEFRYVMEIRNKIAGIVLTHAHEDHIGALPYLLRNINVPVFGTPFTLGIVRNKLEEHGLLASARLHRISPEETVRFGRFELEFIRVFHSVIDGVGIAVQTPLGQVIHTGDFKIAHSADDLSGTDVHRFARCGEKGVLALLSDSTNVERPGHTVPESEIAETLSAHRPAEPGTDHRRPFRIEHLPHQAGAATSPGSWAARWSSTAGASPTASTSPGTWATFGCPRAWKSMPARSTTIRTTKC